jgi:glycosyltransferase involved in cell wall biosynthesis
VGNAVLEALAMETPVVLSREVVLAGDVAAADAGVIASKDELADQVEALRSDPLRRARLGANGRKLVDTRFTWERIADAMAAQYRSMMKGPR